MLAAITQGGQSPVHVTSCTTGIVASDLLRKTDGNYNISFVSYDRREAVIVWFVIHIGEQQVYIKDVGRFSPGIAVAHRFANRGGEIVLVGSPSIWCEVKAVRFDDGTQWAEPSEPDAS